MKSQTPQKYAEYVIIQHLRKDMCYKSATMDAIIDVENTVEYVNTWGDTADKDLEFFNEALTILKNKI